MVLSGQCVYPVLFEPIKQIKLSRSTYKVMSFLDFSPYIKTFESFEKYLESLTRDVEDYDKAGALKYLQEKYAHREEAFDMSDQFVRTMLSPSRNCSHNIQKECERRTKYESACYEEYTMVCNIKRKFKKLISIVKYIRKDLSQTKQHFYEAIDHIKEKPEPEEEEETREKRDAETQRDIDRAIRMFREKPSPEDIKLIDYMSRYRCFPHQLTFLHLECR